MIEFGFMRVRGAIVDVVDDAKGKDREQANGAELARRGHLGGESGRPVNGREEEGGRRRRKMRMKKRKGRRRRRRREGSQWYKVKKGPDVGRE